MLAVESGPMLERCCASPGRPIGLGYDKWGRRPSTMCHFGAGTQARPDHLPRASYATLLAFLYLPPMRGAMSDSSAMSPRRDIVSAELERN